MNETATQENTITVYSGDLEKVEGLLREVALSGEEEFSASWAAGQLEMDVDTVRSCLIALTQTDPGKVEIRYQKAEIRYHLICPQTGKTVASYGAYEELPIDEEFASEDGEFEPFIVAKSDVMVSFRPTIEFIRRCLRERAWRTRECPVTVGEIYDILAELEDRYSKIVDATLWQRPIKDREQANGAVAACCEIRLRVKALGADEASAAPTTSG